MVEIQAGPTCDAEECDNHPEVKLNGVILDDVPFSVFICEEHLKEMKTTSEEPEESAT